MFKHRGNKPNHRQSYVDPVNSSQDMPVSLDAALMAQADPYELPGSSAQVSSIRPPTDASQSMQQNRFYLNNNHTSTAGQPRTGTSDTQFDSDGLHAPSLPNQQSLLMGQSRYAPPTQLYNAQLMMQPVSPEPLDEEDKQAYNSFSAAQTKKQQSASRERNNYRNTRGASLKNSDIEELQSKVAIVSSQLPESIKKTNSKGSFSTSPATKHRFMDENIQMPNRVSLAKEISPYEQVEQITIPKLSFKQDAGPIARKMNNKFSEKVIPKPGQDSSWSRQPADVLLAQQKAQRQFKASIPKPYSKKKEAIIQHFKERDPDLEPSYAQIHIQNKDNDVPKEELQITRALRKVEEQEEVSRPTNIEVKTHRNEVEYYRHSRRATSSEDDSFGDMDELMFDRPTKKNVPKQAQNDFDPSNRVQGNIADYKHSVSSAQQDQTFGKRSGIKDPEEKKQQLSRQGSKKSYFDRLREEANKDSSERRRDEGEEVTQYQISAGAATNEKSNPKEKKSQKLIVDPNGNFRSEEKITSPLTEKLISYRIEQDEYERLLRQKQTEDEQRIYEKQMQRKQKAKEHRDMTFLERQQKFEYDREMKVRQQQLEKQEREANEYDFMPKTRKSSRGANRTRSFDQFLRDQDSFRSRQAKNTAKVKENMQAEEKKAANQIKYVSDKSRKILSQKKQRRVKSAREEAEEVYLQPGVSVQNIDDSSMSDEFAGVDEGITSPKNKMIESGNPRKVDGKPPSSKSAKRKKRSFSDKSPNESRQAYSTMYDKIKAAKPALPMPQTQRVMPGQRTRPFGPKTMFNTMQNNTSKVSQKHSSYSESHQNYFSMANQQSFMEAKRNSADPSFVVPHSPKVAFGNKPMIHKDSNPNVLRKDIKQKDVSSDDSGSDKVFRHMMPTKSWQRRTLNQMSSKDQYFKRGEIHSLDARKDPSGEQSPRNHFVEHVMARNNSYQKKLSSSAKPFARKYSSSSVKSRYQNSVRQANPNAYQNQTKYAKEMPAKETNRAIILRKFNLEFEQKLMSAVNDLSPAMVHERLPSRIDSYEFTQLLVELGCTEVVDMQDDNTKEFKKVEQLWHLLLDVGLESQEETIKVEHTKVVLMALFNIKGDPRVGAVEIPDEARAGIIGSTQDGKLWLSKGDCETIRVKFKLLGQNRTENGHRTFLNRKASFQKMKLSEEIKKDFNCFKPNLLATKMYQKVTRDKEDSVAKEDLRKVDTTNNSYSKLPTEQRLLTNNPKFTALQKILKDQKNEAELEPCTFKPDINKSSKKLNSTYFSTAATQLINQSNSSDTRARMLTDKQSSGDGSSRAASSRSPREKKPLDWNYIKSLTKMKRHEQLFKDAELKERVRNARVMELENRAEEDLRDNCTFKPSINRTTKSAKQSPYAQISPAKKNGNGSKERIDKRRSESKKRAIERTVEARRRKELVAESQRTGKPLSLMERALISPTKSMAKQIKKKPIKYVNKYGSEGPNLKEYFLRKKHKIQGNKNEDLAAALDHYEYPNLMPPEPQLQTSPPTHELSEEKPSPPMTTPNQEPLVSKNTDGIKPLLFVDIDIGEDQKDRITVLPNDTAIDLAQEFCTKHGFDYETQCTLEQQLMLKIEKVKAMMRRRKADGENNKYLSGSGTLQVVEEDEGAEEAAITSDKEMDQLNAENMLPYEQDQHQRFNDQDENETLRKLDYIDQLDEETDDFMKMEAQLQQ